MFIKRPISIAILVITIIFILIFMKMLLTSQKKVLEKIYIINVRRYSYVNCTLGLRYPKISFSI
ncbi:hypothetical protein SH2C18_19530 [Clostridium sediminicola]